MKNILIVEDSVFFQKIIENELKELEYNTFSAYSIKEAMEIINSKKIDLMTLDIELPDGLGYELCKRIKRDSRYAGIQVIVVTNTSDDEAIKKSFEAGALGYIHKDNLKRDLKKYIKNILSIVSNLSFSKNKILLIEDSDFQRKYFKDLLEFARLEVLDFKDIKTAIEYLEKEKPIIDLAVLDYFLSDNTTCTDMILYLKENKFYEQVPTIVLTVSKDLSHKYEIFVIGGNDFLIKPFDTSEFYLRIRNQLKTKHLIDMLDAKNKLLTISSITDELTKLYNRRFFWDNLSKEDNRHKRANSEYSIMLIDIDHFKSINDNFGHGTGDIVLYNVAQTIKKSVRNIDIIARYGGEEFIVLLPDTNKKSAIIVADKILKNVREIKVDFRSEPITVSVGVSSSHETDTSEKTISLADERLYKAKNNGRNRVEYD